MDLRCIARLASHNAFIFQTRPFHLLFLLQSCLIVVDVFYLVFSSFRFIKVVLFHNYILQNPPCLDLSLSDFSLVRFPFFKFDIISKFVFFQITFSGFVLSRVVQFEIRPSSDLPFSDLSLFQACMSFS